MGLIFDPPAFQMWLIKMAVRLRLLGGSQLKLPPVGNKNSDATAAAPRGGAGGKRVDDRGNGKKGLPTGGRRGIPMGLL